MSVTQRSGMWLAMRGTTPRCASLAAGFVLAALAVMSPFSAEASPAGYSVRARAELAPGVVHSSMVRATPSESVQVAQVAAGSSVQLRVVSARDRIGGKGPRLERTSSMCARVGCIVAINGDFFAEEMPVGAVMTGGEMLRSPNPKHHQLMVADDGTLQAGGMRWTGTVVTTDLKNISLDGVNVLRRRNSMVLYTRAFGSTTQTNPYGAEIPLRIVRPAGPIAVGQTVVVRLGELRYAEGDTPIPSDGAVLSGHGPAAAELAALAKRIEAGTAGSEALLRIESAPEVAEAIGGSPVLLRNGKRWFAESTRTFVRARHPRTLVGWNDKGDVWLVTVDGRQPGTSAGFSLGEAAKFMRELGATEAINLDGGGSTTFVVRGRVANLPSDRVVRMNGHDVIVKSARGSARHVERPVANALVLVPVGGVAQADSMKTMRMDIPLARTVTAPLASATDPASDPGGALPALVAVELGSARTVPLGVAIMLIGLVGGAHLRGRRRLSRV